jgi:RNA polymerase sigma factor (sigma-70 family)
MDRQRAWRRRVQRHAKLVCDAVARPAADGMGDRELVGLLRRRIDLLPAQQRAVLVLRLIENLEYEHIAEALGTSVAAVRANLHLARRTLARSVGEQP